MSSKFVQLTVVAGVVNVDLLGFSKQLGDVLEFRKVFWSIEGCVGCKVRVFGLLELWGCTVLGRV